MSNAFTTQLLIDNHSVAGEGDGLTIISPATEDTVARFQGASAGQVDLAVGAARRSLLVAHARLAGVVDQVVVRQLGLRQGFGGVHRRSSCGEGPDLAVGLA